MSLIIPTARNPPKGGSSTSGITALIDADIICYSIGFACQTTIWEVREVVGYKPLATFESKKEMNEWLDIDNRMGEGFVITSRIEADPIQNCLHSVKVFMNGVLEATDAQYYKAYLTGKGNFREEVATILPYKGNRKAPKPVHYQAIRDYLVEHWDAEVIEGMEADDKLSIEQSKATKLGIDPPEMGWPADEIKRTVICSKDKDLLNTPGWHYNWAKDDKPHWVGDEEATYNFYKQLLTGDLDTDNIMGCGSYQTLVYKSGKKKGQEHQRRVGIGPKKASKLLEDCNTEEDMYWACMCAYEKSDYDKPYEALLENGRLLWMLREEGVHWITKW